MLNLYFANLANFFKISSIDFLGNFIYCFIILFFYLPILLATTPCTILNRNDENRFCFLIPNLREKAVRISPLSMVFDYCSNNLAYLHVSNFYFVLKHVSKITLKTADDIIFHEKGLLLFCLGQTDE